MGRTSPGLQEGQGVTFCKKYGMKICVFLSRIHIVLYYWAELGSKNARLKRSKMNRCKNMTLIISDLKYCTRNLQMEVWNF